MANVKAEMSEVEVIMAEGKLLGYEGVELQNFHRDERLARREERRTKLEAEERKAKLEAERHRLEEEERKLRLEQEHELQMKKKELESRHRGGTGDSNGSDSGVSNRGSNERMVRPKLPCFEESKESIDAYITRFEQFAITQGWKSDSWAVSLSALLKGEALNTYYRMPKEHYNNYAEVKKALFFKFQ